ncbi:MAG: hypothetical protein HYU67_07875 [Flavobacteriia bacterium]|nr:hypothetical protein [Flavobacteriia bacterium]
MFNITSTFTQLFSWYVVHPIKKDTLFLGEMGTVQELLIKSGELPDPYYGENENLFTWIEKEKWIFYSKFSITENQMKEEYIELSLPSLDTYTQIYIDNQLVGSTENAFHTHRFQIKKYVKAGENFIQIHFISPINFHKEAYKKRKSQLPAPNDVGEIAVASMSRKPQYQFGWDWALRMNTIGLWKPVNVNAYSENQFDLVKIETISINKENAVLDLFIRLKHKVIEPKTVKSKNFGQFLLEGGTTEFHFKVNINNPTLWWPNGYGEAFLYDDSLFLVNKNGDQIDKKQIYFGIRTAELIQEKDNFGTSFYFKINNQNIFIKGANYIPQDAIPSRVKNKDIVQLIQSAKESNFNMLRVWGGGYYPDEIFYETCDKLGIMIWQDFMFACAMYPGDKHFLDLIEIEANEVIPRISAHPSTVYFNGNNEVDVAWKNWGFQVRYLIGPKTQKEIEEAYIDVFKKLLPKKVKQYSFLPYEHTSPLSNWGKEEFFNHGTMHYWGVWHGKDPIEDFSLKIGRFNAEYGFQSFPEFSTLKTFSNEKDWDLFSSVMKHHQKSYVGNGMIQKHSDYLYGQSFDFKEFVYFSQLTQAKAVSMAISGHRLDSPRCMGTIFWQLNDCWQAPTWSSIDYFLQWKCLQYQVKKDYETVAVLQKGEVVGKERFYIINELPNSFSIQLKIEIFDLQGNRIYNEDEKIDFDGPYLRELVPFTQEDKWVNKNYVIKFSWTGINKKNINRSFFHSTKNYKSEKTSKIEVELKNINEVNKKAQLIIKNDQFLADFWIFSSQIGISYGENFENYLPGEHVIDIQYINLPKIEDFSWFYR